MLSTEENLRQELGSFSSIVCLKAIITGVEEALGEKAAAIAMIAAGRKRGKQLAAALKLSGQSERMSLEQVTEKANEHLGKDGTRLCLIDKIVPIEEGYQVYTRETICSSGEEQGSPRTCTYTLGVLQGFLEEFLGKRLRGTQIASVLRNGTHDVLEYRILG
ncbi:hypothetical protein [Gloeocapsa sp. PCC 73106]|uniref:hypothetical protein n=1 Tax=Gloeocapsa sp. PCC 73106 TaxID=102232 RepID=UPI0002ABB942|nr:hypothetical protein [Gloeocapsa sp. PCC 73106]ELR96871.1 hypothetical protein GLO73106DRAFT_00006700 [Gloeocapsa sp. PCC 73106]